MAVTEIARSARTWIWHPWLFAAFPVLTLYHANIAEVSLLQVLRPLAIMLAVAALLWGVSARLLRDAHKAALCCSFTLLLLFWYGYVRDLLLHSTSPVLVAFGQDGPFLLRPWLFVWVLGLVLILWTRRSLRAWSTPLNATGVTLVLLPLLGIGRALIPLPLPSAPATALATSTPAKALPNIYYIVVDAYARDDTLQRLYHYDNQPFLAYLRQQGFYVARKSRANYSQTSLSLPSTLEMAYLDASRGGQPPQRLSNLSNTAAIRLLRRQGYRIVAFDAECPPQLEHPDRFIPFPAQDAPALTPFEELLVKMTPLALLPRPIVHETMTDYERHRRKIQFQLDHLPVAADAPGPVFVYAHFLGPPPPFVLGHGPDGDPKRPYDSKDGSYFLLEGGTREEYLAGYPVQLDHLNRMLMTAIDRLTKQSKRPTVIILQSDHGPGADTDWDQPERTNFQERLPNFCAIYASDGPLPELYPSITPVNIFRLLFNHYLHTDYPRLPDRCYFSNPAHPLNLIDVTDRVK